MRECWGVCAVIKPCVCVCVGGGLCVLQQGTAWPYSVNGTDCYCGSLQQNLKLPELLKVPVEPDPPGSQFSLEILSLYHKVGSWSCSSQTKHYGESSPHIKQALFFFFFFLQKVWIADLAKS